MFDVRWWCPTAVCCYCAQSHDTLNSIVLVSSSKRALHMCPKSYPMRMPHWPPHSPHSLSLGSHTYHSQQQCVLHRAKHTLKAPARKPLLLVCILSDNETALCLPAAKAPTHQQATHLFEEMGPALRLPLLKAGSTSLGASLTYSSMAVRKSAGSGASCGKLMTCCRAGTVCMAA